MSNKCCSGDGEGRKDKGGGWGSRRKTSCMWRVVCDKVVCERWCVTKKDCARDSCVWRRGCDQVVWKMRQESSTYCREALLHEANEGHHCAMQLVTRECHKHCHVPNVAIEMKRRTFVNPCSLKGLKSIVTVLCPNRKDTARPEATAHSLLRSFFFLRRRYFFYGNKCFFTHTQEYVQEKISQAETYLALKES